MMRTHQHAKEDGYTLVETLVALALFLSVAIPLGVSVGRLMTSDDVARTRMAMRLAESEMAIVSARASFVDASRMEEGFFVERTVVLTGRCVRITVKVSHRSTPEKSLLELEAIVLEKP